MKHGIGLLCFLITGVCRAETPIYATPLQFAVMNDMNSWFSDTVDWGDRTAFIAIRMNRGKRRPAVNCVQSQMKSHLQVCSIVAKLKIDQVTGNFEEECTNLRYYWSGKTLIRIREQNPKNDPFLICADTLNSYRFY